MLCENIKTYRKAKGLSQEELALKLNVVRQTVSKWEKGLSVPDSEMLIRLAEALDVQVTELLGEGTAREEAETLQSLAAKLELLNEQFAKRAERTRKIWRRVFFAVAVIAALILLFEAFSFINYLIHADGLIGKDTIGIIGGADGPTAIFVASASIDIPSFVIALAALAVAIFGIVKTK